MATCIPCYTPPSLKSFCCISLEKQQQCLKLSDNNFFFSSSCIFQFGKSPNSSMFYKWMFSFGRGAALRHQGTLFLCVCVLVLFFWQKLFSWSASRAAEISLQNLSHLLCSASKENKLEVRKLSHLLRKEFHRSFTLLDHIAVIIKKPYTHTHNIPGHIKIFF